MRLANCPALNTQPLTGTWYRAVKIPHLMKTPLDAAHTVTIPGRFNPGTVHHPAFPVLYLAEDHLVALFEVYALLGSPMPGLPYVANPNNPWAIINVHVQLSSVANLCRVNQRKLIETTVQELTGDWRGYLLRNPKPSIAPPHWTNIPTQRLGSSLNALPGLEGFVTYSAKVPTMRTLVIFPDKLAPGSLVRYTDPTTGNVYEIH